MAGITEKWDMEFFRSYLPTLIAELSQIDTLYEGYFHLHSQLHHKLSSMLVQQPHHFQIDMCSSLYHHFVANVEAMHLENKTKVGGLAIMIKEYKVCLFNLANYYRDYEQRCIEIQAHRAKLDGQYEVLLKQQEQMLRRQDQRHNCRYNRTQIMLNIGEVSEVTRNVFLKEKINSIVMQLVEIKQKEERCLVQGNNIIKNCLSKLNACVEKIINKNCSQSNEKANNRGKIDSQKFETFGRETLRKDKQIKSSTSDKERVSQFHNSSKDIKRMIEQAELNCELEGYMKVNDNKASKILQAAILAESKNESEYSEEKQQVHTSQHRYSIK